MRFGETFCLYPFVHHHLTTSKDRKLCCISPHTVDQQRMSEVRNLILDGQKVPECETCYKTENVKRFSRRQYALKDFRHLQSKIQKNVNDHMEGKIPVPFDYDLRYSHLCNLECQTCNADDSSSIALSQNKEVAFLKWEPSLEINSAAERVYLAGGEPFLIKSFAIVLSKIENKNCEIVINTNGTVLTNFLLTELDKFTNVSFYVSIDGYKNLNEHIRKNSSWDDIVKNLKILSDRYGGYKKINVNTVVQKDNVNNLFELGQWLEYLDINNWKLTMCYYPEEFHYSKQKIIFDRRLYTLKLIKSNFNNFQILNEIEHAQNQ